MKLLDSLARWDLLKRSNYSYRTHFWMEHGKDETPPPREWKSLATRIAEECDRNSGTDRPCCKSSLRWDCQTMLAAWPSLITFDMMLKDVGRVLGFWERRSIVPSSLGAAPHLRVFRFGPARFLPKQFFEYLVEGSPLIEEFVLSGLARHTFHELTHLKRLKLRKLGLTHSWTSPPEDILQGHDHLEVIDFRGIPFPSTGMGQREMEMPLYFLPEELLVNLRTQCPKIREISITLDLMEHRNLRRRLGNPFPMLKCFDVEGNRYPDSLS